MTRCECRFSNWKPAVLAVRIREFDDRDAHTSSRNRKADIPPVGRGVRLKRVVPPAGGGLRPYSYVVVGWATLRYPRSRRTSSTSLQVGNCRPLRRL